MGKASRDKGKRGERELANVLKEYGFATQRGVQYHGGPDSPDVIGLPGIHIECKRTERFDLEGAMQQARNDAGDGILPAVFHRKNDKPWVVVMDLDDWIEIYFAYKDYWEQQMLKPDCLHPEDMPKGYLRKLNNALKSCDKIDA